MNTRRGAGRRLGSPAICNARVHAVSKEVARLSRLERIQFRPVKALLTHERVAGADAERRRG